MTSDAIWNNHNEICPEIIQLMITSVIALDGAPADLLVMLESVNVGVLSFLIKGSKANREEILKTMMESIEKRLEEIELMEMDTSGTIQ